MNIVELYINNRLCDTAADFSVRLNRQLLKPDELNTKDAQYSYSITLPPTSNNHEVFNYSNIEETRDKFNREYHAELIINSVRVFKGLFRMSAITRSYYKGNLYIPAVKSIKGIFDFNGKPLSIAKVSNELPGLSVLNYKNQRLTILDNYFTLLIDGGSHYTEVEDYLTPDQYEALNGAIMAMFNGDLYYVAELSGYDPMGRNKTKIKLIRKI